MPYPRGTVLFYHGTALIPLLDWVTQLVTWSPWAHCAMALGDGNAIQSLGGAGVCIREELVQTQMAGLPYPGDVEFVLGQLLGRQGEHYDYLGLAAVPTFDLTRWCWPQPPDRWFCSSLLAEPMRRDPALAAKQRAIAPERPLHAIAPSHIYEALKTP